MFEKVKLTGRTVALHSCGNLSDILGDLIDIGLDIYQTVQPEIYGLKEVKENFGAHLTFWGGISTQKVLPYVTPDEVKKIARETIKILGKGGGYIAAPTHQIPADVPVENVIALAEAFREQ
jgi:uroporphyrinogen decarboxylase